VDLLPHFEVVEEDFRVLGAAEQDRQIVQRVAVVTAWMGHTEKVASKHYLGVTEAHFERALRVRKWRPSVSERVETGAAGSGGKLHGVTRNTTTIGSCITSRDLPDG
jgi:hypothetical protein